MAVQKQIYLPAAYHFVGDRIIETHLDAVLLAETRHAILDGLMVETGAESYDVQPFELAQIIERLAKAVADVVVEILIHGAVVPREGFHPVVEHDQLAVRDTFELPEHLALGPGVEGEMGRDYIVVEAVKGLVQIILEQVRILVVKPDDRSRVVADMRCEMIKNSRIV